MTLDFRLAVAALLGILASAGVAPAADPPKPDLRRLHVAVREVVVAYYPKADVTLDGATIAVAYNTRKFMVHVPRPDGEWQEAHEEVGPKKGGVCGTFQFRPGQYGGQLVLPHSEDMRYFKWYGMAPYSKVIDGHLYVHLKVPPDATPEFLADFRKVVEGFDRYVPTAK